MLYACDHAVVAWAEEGPFPFQSGHYSERPMRVRVFWYWSCPFVFTLFAFLYYELTICEGHGTPGYDSTLNCVFQSLVSFTA